MKEWEKVVYTDIETNIRGRQWWNNEQVQKLANSKKKEGQYEIVTSNVCSVPFFT